MTKSPIQEEDITCINIYTPNIRAPKYIKQILTDTKEKLKIIQQEEEIFNTPFTSMDRLSRQKINKKTMALNDTLDQWDLIDIYRKFHLEPTDYIFFSSAHGTFSGISYVLDHKASLDKFNMTEFISGIFSRSFHRGSVLNESD